MKCYRFELMLGTALFSAFGGFWAWQNSGYTRGRLTAGEIERYMAAARNLYLPPDVAPQFFSRLRAWMEADDGRPFYNLNLMRFHPTLQRFPGAPVFNGTPEESNAHYESATAPKLFKLGGYPTFSGAVRSENLVGYEPEVDNWKRVVIARYPSRRAFLDLITDPEYQKLEPYKAMAVELVLVPMTPQIVVPEATWIAGAAGVFMFLLAGWVRAATVKRNPGA